MRPTRRGIVLLAVLVVVVLASLVGTTVLIVADADRAGAEVSLRRTQSRALAWSGVQAVMAELASQRDDLLDGARPRVTEEWTVVGADGDPVRGIYRLVPLGPDGPLESESAKVDLNTATDEMLARLPGVGPEIAGRIVAARGTTLLGSTEELLGVEGIGPDLFYGPVSQAGSGSPGAARGAGRGSNPLAGLATVFSSDPNVQSGLGASGVGYRGELRLNINAPWSERLERALAKRFDQGFADGVKGILERRTFRKDSDIVAVLNEFKVDPKEWVQTFDVFTTTPDEYLYGRVDLNTADAQTLACIPGIDDAAAGSIVGRRGLLAQESLRSVAWPASEGVLTPEQFQLAVDYLTTRSMQWRVRVEAGFEAVAVADSTRAETDAPKLRDRIVLEAVIDIASERPRVAYLRDITMLDAARAAFTAASGGDVEHAPMAEPNRGGTEGDPADDQATGAQGPSRLAQRPSRLQAARQRDERIEVGIPARLSRGVDVEAEAGDLPASLDRPPEAQDILEAGPDRRMGRWNPAGGSQGGRR